VRLLIVDYGSSTNYGDKMVGQIVRQSLTNLVPNLIIRQATPVVDAAAAGFHQATDAMAPMMVNGIDAALILGGSIWFGLTIEAARWAWLDQARFPIISWGGLQHLRECYDQSDLLAPILRRIDHRFCRFAGETNLYSDLGAICEVGGDPLFLRPRFQGIMENRLGLSITPPYGPGGCLDFAKMDDVTRFVAEVANTDFPRVSVLRADARVASAEQMGILPPVDVVEEDHWIEAHLSSCRMLITTRLHPAVTALHHGVPTIAVDFSDKLRLLLEGMDLGELCVDFEDATPARLHAVYAYINEHYDSVVERIHRASDMMRGQATSTMKKVASLIAAHS
jgi:hypothetical protein